MIRNSRIVALKLLSNVILSSSSEKAMALHSSALA